ncbi:hypothetical protein Tco_1570837 [Tanacetum coccineum]
MKDNKLALDLSVSQAESDQKDKMRHAIDEKVIALKKIHERRRERAITAEAAPNDTKPLTTFQNLKRTNERD